MNRQGLFERADGHMWDVKVISNKALGTISGPTV